MSKELVPPARRQVYIVRIVRGVLTRTAGCDDFVDVSCVCVSRVCVFNQPVIITFEFVVSLIVLQ